MRPCYIAMLATLATLAVAPLADAKLSRTAEPARAHFHAATNVGMAIDGETAEVTVSEEGGNVKITVALGSIVTGMSLRDRHARELLEVGKFPTTTLTVPRSALAFPEPGAQTGGDVKGILNLHGQDKQVTFHYTSKRNGAALAVTGTVAIDITNFGLAEPSHLGVRVKKDVSVDIAFVAQDT